MQPQTMAGVGGVVGGLFFLVYIACVIGIVICLIRLLYRFVSAHERAANALEIVARKMKDDGKP
jgi:hypothetical protein